MPASNPRHLKGSVKWGTPSDLVERARTVLGSIDLDPCSSTSFNTVVKASQYYSLDDRGEDGLKLPWRGKVFCNPPGGLVREFWAKAMTEPIESMIWIGFSLEQLALLSDGARHPLDFITCIPRKRIHFTRDDGYNGSPTHSNYITGYNVGQEAFSQAFSSLGRVFPGTLIR